VALWRSYGGAQFLMSEMPLYRDGLALSMRTHRGCEDGGKTCLLIRKHDHFTLTREIKRHVRALARNYPEGWKFGSWTGILSV